MAEVVTLFSPSVSPSNNPSSVSAGLQTAPTTLGEALRNVGEKMDYYVSKEDSKIEERGGKVAYRDKENKKSSTQNRNNGQKKTAEKDDSQQPEMDERFPCCTGAKLTLGTKENQKKKLRRRLSSARLCTLLLDEVRKSFKSRLLIPLIT